MADGINGMVSAPVRTVSKPTLASPVSSSAGSVSGSPRQQASTPESDGDSNSLSEDDHQLQNQEHSQIQQPPAQQLTQHQPQTQLAAPATQAAYAPNGTSSHTNVSRDSSDQERPPNTARRSSFGLGFFSSLSNTIRGGGPSSNNHLDHGAFMSNSPTIANLNNFAHPLDPAVERSVLVTEEPLLAADQTAVRDDDTPDNGNILADTADNMDLPENGQDKDGSFSVRLTPIIDHSSSSTGLYFSPLIRRVPPTNLISIGRYTEKNKSAAHAPQGLSAPIVFKLKVVSRTHALLQCNAQGSWFLKDCKSSSGTFLNNIRLSQASQELTLWPLVDGDVIQLGLDYRGGTEEVYRCVKMRCEFNRSWQRKVNQFNLDIHRKMRNLGILDSTGVGALGEELNECAICLLKLEPCQALFISPCSHSWHYKCIRPIIIKSYPQFYCPNCRSMCDLETDIEDEE